jgi:hypothetical protein
MSKRIYLVTESASDKARLVEAATPAQALRHVARNVYAVKPANTYEVASLVSRGVALETTDEPVTEPAEV